MWPTTIDQGLSTFFFRGCSREDCTLRQKKQRKEVSFWSKPHAVGPGLLVLVGRRSPFFFVIDFNFLQNPCRPTPFIFCRGNSAQDTEIPVREICPI